MRVPGSLRLPSSSGASKHFNVKSAAVKLRSGWLRFNKDSMARSVQHKLAKDGIKNQNSCDST
jgi:hypothetical protein